MDDIHLLRVVIGFSINIRANKIKTNKALQKFYLKNHLVISVVHVFKFSSSPLGILFIEDIYLTSHQAKFDTKSFHSWEWVGVMPESRHVQLSQNC